MPSSGLMAVMFGLVVATTISLYYYFAREEEERCQTTGCQSSNTYNYYNNGSSSYSDNGWTRRRIRNNSESSEICTICRELLMGQNQTVLKPCKHIFHKECILRWRIETSRPLCPNCRCVYVNH